GAGTAVLTPGRPAGRGARGFPTRMPDRGRWPAAAAWAKVCATTQGGGYAHTDWTAARAAACSAVVRGAAAADAGDRVPRRDRSRRLLRERKARRRAWALGRARAVDPRRQPDRGAGMVHRRLAAGADGRRAVDRARALRGGQRHRAHAGWRPSRLARTALHGVRP